MSKSNRFFRVICSCALTAGAIYAFNRIYNIAATRKHLLKSDSSNHFNWNGLNVHYEVKGTGSPVLMLHALHPAASSYEWNRITDRLSEHHTVYLVDLPGCGRSEKPKALFTAFYYVQFIRDFIKIMSLHHVSIVASNLTSIVPIIAEAYEPGLADRIILINPPSVSKSKEVPDFISKAKSFFIRMPLVGTFLYCIMGSRPQIDNYFAEKYFYNPFHDSDDLVDIYLESAHLDHENGRYLAASMVANYLNMDIQHSLSAASVPIKIIEGSATEHAEDTVQEWLAIKPDIAVDMIEHTRQLPMIEEPDATAEAILSFL